MEDIDPSQRLQLDVLEEEYRRRHGVAIEWLKAKVGEGEVFENSVGRVVLSQNGAWFECIDLPMEFSASVGEPCERRFISDRELRELSGRLTDVAYSLPADGVLDFGLLLLYGRTGIVDEKGAFIYQQRRGADGEIRAPIQAGSARPDILPALLRCRIHADAELPGVPLRHGVIICLNGVGEKNLLVIMPHEGEDLRDLGGMNEGSLPH